MMNCLYWGMHGFGLMWIFPLLLFGALIWFLSRGTARFSPREGRETTSAILDRRYASGEITKEQYDQMRKDLNVK